MSDVNEEVKVEEAEVVAEVAKEEAPKPAPKKAAKKKAAKKAVAKVTAGDEWWDTVGEKLVRKGCGQRGVFLKAKIASGATQDAFNAAMVAEGTLEEKVKALF